MRFALFRHLEIFNFLGQKIRTLMREEVPVGFYRVVWDGRDDQGREVASGIYLYRLSTGRQVMTRKLLLLQ